MSNLATINIQNVDEYENLATLASVTFVSGNKYTIQVNGDVILCESATKPDKSGFRINFNYPFEYEAGDDPLWIKAFTKLKNNIVTIAD